MHAPLSPAFRVERKGFSALSSIAGEWRALIARAIEPNVFYEPAFAIAAAPVLGAGAEAILVWSQQRLVGFVPVRIKRHCYGPYAALVGWTHEYGPLGVPLIDRDGAVATIGALLDHLANDPAWPGLLMLPLIPQDGPFAAALRETVKHRALSTATFGRHQRALLAPGAERANYLERAVSAGRRKEMRRQRRRLSDAAPVTFADASAAADVSAALAEFFALEASGWKGEAGTAAALKPPIREFMTAAVANLAIEGKARVERLHHGSRTIAASITLSSGDTAWCWKIAYDESIAHASPGVQLVFDLTRTLLADARIGRVDSCATADHPMIDHIWRERLPLANQLIAVRSSATTFRFACGIERLRRSAANRIRALRNRLRGR